MSIIDILALGGPHLEDGDGLAAAPGNFHSNGATNVKCALVATSPYLGEATTWYIPITLNISKMYHYKPHIEGHVGTAIRLQREGRDLVPRVNKRIF